MNLDWRMQRSNYGAVVESQLFGGSAFKGCLNQEISRQYQNLIHCKSYDDCAVSEASSSRESPFSSIHGTRVGFGVSPGYCDPNLSCSDFNYSMASNAGCSMLRLNDRYTSQYFQQSSNDYHRVSSMLLAADFKGMPSLKGLNQINGKVVSPEKISSTGRCSHAEWYSYKEPFEIGASVGIGTYTEPRSGDNNKCNAWFREHISPWIPEDANALSSMALSKTELSHEQLSQYGLQSKQCHLQSCPPAHFDIPFEVQIQASRPTDSIRFWQNILVSYVNCKSKLVHAGKSQQDFVDHLHLTVCEAQTCECEKYHFLISHFNNCHNAGCKICGPVHQLFHAKKISSGPVFESCPINKMTAELGKPKGFVARGLHPRDHMIQDMQPTPKRMKIENADQHDDWSLGAIVLPHLKQRAGGLLDDWADTKKMSKEVLSSKESPITAVTWNATLQNDGSKGPKVCFRKTDGFLGLGQSPEALINSAGLNKEVPSSIGNLGKSLQTFTDAFDDTNLGNNYAISHLEVLNLIDEQQDIGCVESSKVKSDVTCSCQSLNSDGVSVFPEELTIDDGENNKLMTDTEHDNVDAKYDLADSDYQCGRKLEDLKVSGVSLTDFFTAKQIKEHLSSLNPHINPNTGNGNMPAPAVGPNTCQLCALDGLTFNAPAMYCASCGAQIRHRMTYYWTQDGMGARYCFCTICFKQSRGGNISFRGLSFSKVKLCKDKNTEESGEAWVQCDKCEHWQHQICALYNSERDLKGKVKYICPFCRLAEIEAMHASIPPASGARDLPRTKLSDHIEQRLFRSIEQERKQRAELIGKNKEEVPGASDLIVRVVLAVNKQLKVKQQFLDIVHRETYPTEFPYKSKVILLFQQIEGADVCLFAMYVQEFGSECGNPNKHSVYISYLDSVKYFRPEIKTVAGVALRTFVYYEILIGYLDYCKRRGFATCYIWACPSLRGDDYILHCHPQTQKRPNSNKLVQWYKKMLRKAKEENVVVGLTNLYDYFFVPSGESNHKITAAQLPHFDGDYWSGAIEDIIQTIEKDSGGDSERQLKNQMTKRTLKAMGHSDLSVDTTKDVLVMQKLGHRILPVKEEFIVIHLQFTCTNCREIILSGGRWSCKQCSKFHLCGRCLEHEQFSTGLKTHMTIHGEKHQLYQVPVNDVAADTEDKDCLLENDFFDDRHSFLNFCRKNHYQFDTLRRAKHSSMMILHHLHTSTAASMGTICSICNQDFMVGWHCEICYRFRVCNACYQKEGDGCHVHKLVQHLMKADSGEKNEQMQQQTASEVRMMLDLLKHANQCRSNKDNPCSYPKCLLVKKLFLHNRECKRRVAGGCDNCKKIWCMLHLHSESCRGSNCNIPRCRDIKNYKKMMATRSDLQQRLAVNNLNG